MAKKDSTLTSIRESSKSLFQQRKLAKSFLSEGDAEFLLEMAKDGKLKIRVGQIWKVPERKGETCLQVDLDNCKAYSRGTIYARLRKAGVQPLRICSRISPGGQGLHLLIWIKGTFGRYQRVCLQLLCESDPEREAQNFRRAGLAGKNWQENWQVLFK